MRYEFHKKYIADDAIRYIFSMKLAKQKLSIAYFIMMANAFPNERFVQNRRTLNMYWKVEISFNMSFIITRTIIIM